MGLIGAPTYRMLEDVTYRTMLDILGEEGIPFTEHRSQFRIELTEPGSSIIFRTLDDPERLRGTNLSWFGVDELSYCKEESWERLEARLRDPKATHLCGFGGWTPQGFNWAWERFIGPQKKSGYIAVIARPGENKAILEAVPDFYDRLKASYDEKFYRQEVLGEYLNVFTGRVYHAFDRYIHTARQLWNPLLPISWALDFNIDPMCSVICQIEDEPAQIYGQRYRTVRVLEELYLKNTDTRQACEAFKAAVLPRIGVRPLQVVIYGDASGANRQTSGSTDWKVIDKFFKDQPRGFFNVQFKVPTANPAVKNRVNAMNGLLRSATGRLGLMVDPGCEELITDLERVAWAVDGNKNYSGEFDKSDPKRTHVSDALGYLVEQEFGLRVVGGFQSKSPIFSPSN